MAIQEDIIVKKINPDATRMNPTTLQKIFPRSTLASLVVAATLQLTAGTALAIDTVTPAIDGVVAAGTPIQFIKDGFNGTEGPVSLPDGSLIFTETQANRIVKIAADGSISTYQDNTNGSNGLGFNPQGDLVSVQVLDPKVGVVAPASKAKVLADKFNGTPFVRPNDLVVSSKGHVYFTDSGLPRLDPTAPPPAVAPVPRPGVFHISPDGKLSRLDNSIQRPNGIQLSRDEKTLYVANTAGEHVIAFDVAQDGSVSNQRNFAKLDGFAQTETGPSSGADGLAIDDAGRLYVTSNLGIQVFDSKGKALGTIPLPQKPQNLAFAGKDKKSLYVVGRGAAYKIATLTPGYKGRAK